MEHQIISELVSFRKNPDFRMLLEFFLPQFFLFILLICHLIICGNILAKKYTRILETLTLTYLPTIPLDIFFLQEHVSTLSDEHSQRDFD